MASRVPGMVVHTEEELFLREEPLEQGSPCGGAGGRRDDMLGMRAKAFDGALKGARGTNKAGVELVAVPRQRGQAVSAWARRHGSRKARLAARGVDGGAGADADAVRAGVLQRAGEGVRGSLAVGGRGGLGG